MGPKPEQGAKPPSSTPQLNLLTLERSLSTGRPGVSESGPSSSYIRLLIITMTERIMHSEKKTCRIYQINKKNEQQLILVMNVSTLVYTTYVQ